MFMRGEKFQLEALSNEWADMFCRGINEGLTLQYTLTGSIPMRQIDVVECWEKERKAGSVQWSIITCEQGFVGTCGLYSHRDIYHSWELRILIFHPDAIGKGIGEEAVKLITAYAFERLNAHRVWAGTHQDNIGMQKCFSRAGYKEEGRLREELYCFGKYADAVRYGILRDEWTSPSLVVDL
jgi:RimJ/RimL family protein N-acetyltransferase